MAAQTAPAAVQSTKAPVATSKPTVAAPQIGGDQSAASTYGNAATGRANPDPTTTAPTVGDTQSKGLIERSLAGTRAAADVLMLIGSLSSADRTAYSTEVQLKRFAKVLTGELFMVAAHALNADFDKFIAMKLAWKAKTPITAAQAAPYFADWDNSEWDSAAKNVAFITWVKGLYSKTPPGAVSVSLGMLYGDLLKSSVLLKWAADTTDGLMFAYAVGNMDIALLAATLTKISGWTWLDRLSAASALDRTVHTLLDKLKPKAPAAIKVIIEKRLADAKVTVATSVVPMDELKKLAAAAGIPDAATIIRMVNEEDPAAVITLFGKPNIRTGLRRGLDANHVMQLMGILVPPVAMALEWLSGAKGATAAHLMKVMDDLSASGANFASTAQVTQMRKIAGSALAGPVLTNYWPEVTKAMLTNDALFAWCTASGGAATYIKAFAKKDADHVGLMAKRFAAKGVGMDWLAQLPPGRHTTTLIQLAAVLGGTGSAFIKKWLAKVTTTSGKVSASDVAATDKAVTRSPWQKLMAILKAPGGDSDDLMLLVAAITPTERAKLSKDHLMIGALLKRLEGDGIARVAGLLSLSRVTMMKSLTVRKIQMVPTGFEALLRTASSAEQLRVASDATATKKIANGLNIPLMAALPALRDAGRLATALGKNAMLVQHLSKNMSDHRLLELLGASTGSAKAAAPQLDKHIEVFEDLPSRVALGRSLKAALTRFSTLLTHKQAKAKVAQALSAKKGEDHDDDLDTTAKALTAARGLPLWQGLKPLLKKGDDQEIHSLCYQSKVSDIKLLFASHQDVVKELHKQLNTAPLGVFPALGNKVIPEMLSGAAGFQWLVETSTTVATLNNLTSTTAITAKAAGFMDAQSKARAWVRSLPSGVAMASGERERAKRLFDRVTGVKTSARLFKARFGKVPKGKMNRAHLVSLWTILARLPDRNIASNEGFNSIEMKGDSGGTWHEDVGMVRVGGKPKDGDTVSYGWGPWRSKVALVKLMGISAANFARRVKAGSIKSKKKGTKKVYRPAKVKDESFTHTVLHEVGHAVDTMLGGRTDIVYSKAGWKSYGTSEVSAWVGEMGGWAGATISAGDKGKIEEVFSLRLGSDNTIAGPSVGAPALAPKTHPIHNSAYKTAVLLKEVHSKKDAFSYHAPFTHGSRVYLMNYYYSRFMSVNKDALALIPRTYAQFAPQEWFADIYAEYYRAFDGTAKTEKNKGGNLPGWVKKWFTEHVDKLGKTPHAIKAKK